MVRQPICPKDHTPSVRSGEGLSRRDTVHQSDSVRCVNGILTYAHAHFVCLVCSRTSRHTVLPVYGRIVQSRPPQRDGIKWGIVSYTVVMFSIVTAVTGIQFDIHSLCYIDNREFPNVGDMLPPGPFGYHSFVSSDTPTVVDAIMFLKGWLTDGLLVSFFLFRAVFTHPGV